MTEPESEPPAAISRSIPSHTSETGTEIADLLHVLDRARNASASDVHLTAGAVPRIRIGGQLQVLDGAAALCREAMVRTLDHMMPQECRAAWDRTGSLEFSWSVPGIGRFRISAYKQRGSPALSIRLVPLHPVPTERLGIPPTATNLVMQSQGIVLITGLSASGKSTTLSGLCDLINRTRQCHIITLEDPIEYLHAHQKAIVNQREVGLDVQSFDAGIQSALSADPDVIFLSRVPDADTAEGVLRAAETGRLVVATMNARNSLAALEDFFRLLPPDQRDHSRRRLAHVLQGIIAQHLLPRAEALVPASVNSDPKDGPLAPAQPHEAASWSSMVAAFEVLVASPQIRALIESGKIDSIPLAMATDENFGMIRMDQAIDRLLHDGYITPRSLSLAR